MISDFKFPNNTFETAEFWFIVFFTFITTEKLYISLIFSFYCCLVKDGGALKVA